MSRLGSAVRLVLVAGVSLGVFAAVAAAASPRTRTERIAARLAAASARSSSSSMVAQRTGLPVPPPFKRGVLQAPVPHDRTTLAAIPDAARAPLWSGDASALPLPTNAWWSGGILEDWPAPLFAWPLVTSLQADGLAVTAPGRVTSPKAVVQKPGAPLRVIPPVSLRKARVLSWGDWDVTFRLLDSADKPVADVTTAQGSPYLQVRPYAASFAVEPPAAAKAETLPCAAPCSVAMLLRGTDASYVVAVRDGTLALRGGRLEAAFSGPDALLTVAVVAPGAAPQDYVASAFAPLAGSRVSYEVQGDSVTTAYRAAAPTLLGVFPHQQPYLSGVPGKKVGEYETVRGTVTLYQAQAFSTVLPFSPPPPFLPVSAALAKDPAFIGLLRGEIVEKRPLAGDVYGSAKDVLRQAQLAELADTVDPALRRDALEQAKAKLVAWCTAGTDVYGFSYDPRVGGIIASPVAFGSEHYNDHHFHYGYFLHAAAIVTRLDPSFASSYGECMRLMLRDIASQDRADPSFPFLRYFDPYAGHSWANGLTRFGDGQNQESVSEAAHAWFGVWLWGKTTGDLRTQQLGAWLMAQESAAAKAYWFNAQPSAPTLPADFPQPMVSILWGGKADYATFFDGSDEAVRGIQFFPVGTALFPLVDDGILQRIVEPTSLTAGDNIWRSSLQLVSALRSARAADPVLKRTQAIDPGLSQSYIRSWVDALSGLGALQSGYRLGGCSGAVFQKGNVRTLLTYRFAGDADRCTVTDAQGKAKAVGGLTMGWNVRAF